MSSTYREKRHKNDYYIIPVKIVNIFLNHILEIEPDFLNGFILDSSISR